MQEPQRVDAHELRWAARGMATRHSRDLGDLALWEASAHKSLQRRRAVQRAGGAGRTRTAAVAVGVAVSATAVAAPAATYAHRVTSGTAASAQGGLPAIQRALGVAADGVMGPQTRAAIRAFQRDKGLVVDGIVGPQTRAALGIGSASRSSTSASNQRGDWVAEVQRKLGISADGVFGPQTRKAVRAFQAARGLAVDGVVGPATRAALGLTGDSTASAAEPSAAVKSAGGSTSGVVAAARAQVGKPYAYGGNGPGAFDCSGLTVHAFRAAGRSLPRTSFAQFGVGSPVSRDQIQAGDLVFFDSNGPGASHVGIATSPTTFVSATSRGVMETSLNSSYWSSHYVGARRA